MTIFYYLCGAMDKKYTKEEEWINAVSHGVGFVMSVAVCTLFLAYGYKSGDTITKTSLWLYMLGVLSSYLFSTLYHACRASSEWKQRLRRIDHAAIYWHIAGSYSPITLIALRDVDYWGWGIFFFCWLCAFVGTLLSIFNFKKQNRLETLCYVLMGMTILVAFKPFYENVDGWILFWVIAEGVSYIIGAILYSFHKVKYIHSVFHLFVIVGDICHMIAVWKIIEIYLSA